MRFGKIDYSNEYLGYGIDELQFNIANDDSILTPILRDKTGGITAVHPKVAAMVRYLAVDLVSEKLQATVHCSFGRDFFIEGLHCFFSDVIALVLDNYVYYRTPDALRALNNKLSVDMYSLNKVNPVTRYTAVEIANSSFSKAPVYYYPAKILSKTNPKKFSAYISVFKLLIGADQEHILPANIADALHDIQHYSRAYYDMVCGDVDNVDYNKMVNFRELVHKAHAYIATAVLLETAKEL